MNASASGAVFFLGSRAHYQVLTPPSTDSNENANTSSETLYDNTSAFQWPSNANSQTSINTGDFLINEKETVSEIPKKNKDFLYGDGVKRRLRKSKKQDGSSEKILNDNDSIASADVRSIDSDKSKSHSRSSLGHLAALLSRLVRGPKQSARPKEPVVCTFRNACRCDDCQVLTLNPVRKTVILGYKNSHYFKCDNDDDVYSISDDSEFSQQYAEYIQQYSDYADSLDYESLDSPQYECSPDCTECGTKYVTGNDSASVSPIMDDDDDDEVFIDSPPAPPRTVTPPALPRPPALLDDDEEKEQTMMELAVGAPFLLDHFMSAPACAIM